MDKSKHNYLSEWFNDVPARWYGMTTVLIALAAVGIAAIVWLANKGLDWWWIALGVVVVLVFITFSFLAYRKVAIERDKVVEEKDKLAVELSSAKKVSSTQVMGASRYIPDKIISGRVINLMDLISPLEPAIISDRTIEDCEIRGPAMLWGLPPSGMSMYDCRIESREDDIDAVFVEIKTPRWLFGAIGLRGCVFRRCRFVGIGLLGNKQDIKRWKKEFTVNITNRQTE
jgi:hypothetical protein